MKNEIGSYFHLIENGNANQESHFLHPTTGFEEAYHLFYSGRHAVKAILLDISKTREINTIWMPDYYCQHVVRWMQKNFPKLRFYNSQPFEFNEPLRIPEHASSDDVLIVNNYWGLSNVVTSQRPISGPLLIEDHSHGWLSQQSKNSHADYCFVSLRKSLPIPLGGMCWRPGRRMAKPDSRPSALIYSSWDRMIEAMQRKQKYLAGSKVEKAGFLTDFGKVEGALDESHGIVAMRDEDACFIEQFLHADVMKPKEENLRYLSRAIHNGALYRVINRERHTPFGLMLRFNDKIIFDSFKRILIEHDIYPSHLWPDNDLKGDWAYLLNIHVDFRYTYEDMDHIVDVLQICEKRLESGKT
jgi:hypothetical protein